MEPQEDLDLAEMYPTAKVEDMVDHFKRTDKSIVSHAWELGIKRNVPRSSQRRVLTKNRVYEEIMEAQRRLKAKKQHQWRENKMSKKIPTPKDLGCKVSNM